MIIYGFAGGLDQENVSTADSLFQRNGSFAVGKGFNSALAHSEPKLLTDSLCKGRVGITTENLNIVSVCNHFKTYWWLIFCCLVWELQVI